MASKCCSKCANTFFLSSFLKDPSNPKSRVFQLCVKCRAQATSHRNKRKALQPLDANIPSKRPAAARTKPTEAPFIPPQIYSKIHPKPSICPIAPSESRPVLIPPVPESPQPPPQPPPPPLPVRS